jgi:hypothetical protein
VSRSKSIGASPEVEATLVRFLSRALGPKRERFVGLVTSPSRRSKFLNSLHHELERSFDRSSLVASLPQHAWQLPALRFAPPNDFGVEQPSLTAAYDLRVYTQLVISIDARYGFLRAEGQMDAQLFVDASK